MDFARMFDPIAASIVISGTLGATALRSGLADCGAALGALVQRRFRADQVRGALAPMVAQAEREGLLRANLRPSGDATIDSALGVLIQTRSLAAFVNSDDAAREARVSRSVRAVRTLALGAELSPVFGLAGTLISLSQLPVEGLARGAFMGAISMAVLTTLYGLLLGNLILAPLSRAVERRVEAEEAARREIADWLIAKLGPVCPPVQAAGSAVRRAYLREVP
ncbi:MotA/TolQ/ExbB proton channel family protein [Novosphingobium sp.]|uniref:MotA/TolQ/ExbB proton channel family protein n=1 Tax=Novosphingobium sp. TaxID=1874826 RepID=UPI001D425722|nr:MotA/TolQ/ExbB proton channel family protein [Novosphingobium sp.]MBX9662867.1 MotA/TolQ/ExbB proton channel family protein [Novosphingobium sp.]